MLLRGNRIRFSICLRILTLVFRGFDKSSFRFEFFFRNLVTSCSLGVVVDLPVKDNDADLNFLRCIREFQSIAMLKVTLVWCDG